MKLGLIITLMFITNALYAQFRNTNWGDSKEKIKQIETAEYSKSGEELEMYYDKIASMNAYILYRFVDNKLVRASYRFSDKHTNKNIYLDDYQKIKKLLTKKYGESKEDKSIWTNDLYRDDFSQYGMAISVGHYYKYANWENKDTSIQLGIKGDNFEIKLYILYISKKFDQLYKDRKEEENTSGL